MSIDSRPLAGATLRSSRKAAGVPADSVTPSLGLARSGDGPAAQAIWPDLLADLRAELGEEKVERWFVHAQVLQDDGQVFSLGVPNLFIQEWIQQRYLPALERIVTERIGVRRVRLRVDGELYREFRRAESEFLRSQAPVLDEPTTRPPEARRASSVSAAEALNPDFTLESFLPGPGNQVCLGVVRRILECPDHPYNPLCMHGRSGVGKTHLLQALARAAEVHWPGRVRYLQSEAFANGFISAVRGGQVERFRRGLRGLRFLLLDDAQAFQRKHKTQLELMHLMDELIAQGGHLVLASDLPPADLTEIHPALRGRWCAGLVCRLAPPDPVACGRILRERCARWGWTAPDEVITTLAQRHGGNVRELLGALTQVKARAHLTGAEPARALAESQACPVRGPGRPLRLETILIEVTRATGHSVEALRSRARSRSLSRARQLAIFLARRLTPLSLADLGTAFGGRNHATITFALRQVELRRQGEPGFSMQVEAMLARLATR